MYCKVETDDAIMPSFSSSKESMRPSMMQFKFDNFAKLPSVVNRAVLSKVQVDSNGNKWQLELFPGGFCAHNAQPPTADEQMIGFFICLCDTPNGDNSVNAIVSFSVRNALGKVVKEVVWHVDQGADFCLKKNTPTGGSFLKRSIILEDANKLLMNGALVVDVCIQLIENPDLYAESLNYTHFRPTNMNPSQCNIMKLLESGQMSDVSFKVRNKIFNAHKLIVHANAPLLAKYFEEGGLDGNSTNTIEIKKIKPLVFWHVLCYVYAGNLIYDRKFIECHGMRMIRAANRFGIPGLKAAVETALARYKIIDLRNAAEIILFADSMNCPHLKEYAVQYFVSRPNDILHSEFSEKRDKLKSKIKLFQQLMIAVEREKLLTDSRGDSVARKGSFGEESFGSFGFDLSSCFGKTLAIMSSLAISAVGSCVDTESLNEWSLNEWIYFF